MLVLSLTARPIRLTLRQVLSPLCCPRRCALRLCLCLCLLRFGDFSRVLHFCLLLCCFREAHSGVLFLEVRRNLRIAGPAGQRHFIAAQMDILIGKERGRVLDDRIDHLVESR